MYILAGSVRCGDTEVAAHHTAVLTRCTQLVGGENICITSLKSLRLRKLLD